MTVLLTFIKLRELFRGGKGLKIKLQLNKQVWDQVNNLSFFFNHVSHTLFNYCHSLCNWKCLPIGCAVGHDEITTIESLQFDFAAVEAATNKFALDWKLGEGGFGEVYKVWHFVMASKYVENAMRVCDTTH